MAGRRILRSILLTSILLFTDAQESDGPKIINPPTSEIVLQNGQNYTLLCRSSRPIKFKQQDIPEENNGMFQLVPRMGNNESEYWVALDLYNVDQYAVGYYACFDDNKNDKDIFKFIFEESENITKNYLDYTYVYVNVLAAEAPPPPKVEGGYYRQFLEGENFTINCSVPKKSNPIDLRWTYPVSANSSKIKQATNNHEIFGLNSVLQLNLTVINASKEEAGIYICTLLHDGKEISSSFTKEYLEKPVLDVIKRPDSGGSRPGKRKFTSLTAYFNAAYPPPTVTAYRDNIMIHPGSPDRKYSTAQDPYSYNLKILNLSAEDTGTYTLVFSNGDSKSLVYPVEVRSAPKIYFNPNSEKKYVKGSRASLQCVVVGFPLPEVQWNFTDDDANLKTPLMKGRQVNITNTEKAKYKLVSTITLPVTVSGNVTCIATNEEGKDEADQRFLVYEMNDGFGIKDADKMWFSEGDDVFLKCFASKYDFVDVTWVNNYNEEMPFVEKTADTLSLIAHLTINSISVPQKGLYTCMGTREGGEQEFSNVNVTVAPIQPPIFVGPETETHTVKLFEKVNISCIAAAVPPPTIQWYKDGSLLKFTSKIMNETKILNRTAVNSTITIYPMQGDYGGEYACKVTSKDNDAIKTFNLVVNDEITPHKTIYISVAGVIFFLLILIVVYLAWKIKKEKQFRKELAAAGLLYFKEGMTKSINPDLGIDEQAELLPYDDRFEFPAEKLTLGKQLGAGAFGVVYKAEARGIINAEETTTVAVKMVKKTADNMYIKALASELKIMVHLGKHINIVNLLGACTKNVGKRELVVIVEYCKFGNIHNYLQKHREVFIDQLNDNTEKSLGKVNRGFSCSSGNSALNSDYFGSNHTQETDNTFLNTANSNRSGRKDNQTPKETQTKQMELAKVSESGYIQPEWRSNYESDYSFDGRSPRPLCSRDLLAWSFQIARGMEYLASRKILHGDLAARNILLAEDNVVKICDFGLARSIYKNDEYQKKEDSLLPVKWLAIECMTDRIFTTQSDVWSFGIVLWEIFSLAKTPYPNINPKTLLQWLAEGHRLEKPAHADDKLYDVMKKCWLQKPTTRPTFTQLQETLGAFLEDNVRNHYVDLNATNLDMNVKQAGEEDYLAIVSAPDYNNLVTPSPHHYVNEVKSFFPVTPTQLQQDDEGYLQMSPASRQTVFNARVQGNKFDFDARKLTPKVPETNNYGESTPMLTLNNLPRSGSESDHDGNSSPYMNMCTKIVEEKDDDVFGTKENNAKNIQHVAVTNPTYITLSNDDEKKPQNFANSYINVSVPNGLVK